MVPGQPAALQKTAYSVKYILTLRHSGKIFALEKFFFDHV